MSRSCTLPNLPELRSREAPGLLLHYRVIDSCPPRGLSGGEAGSAPQIALAGALISSAAVGRVMWKVAPRPELFVAHTRPPCDSTMERVMDNPMPLPCGLVVKNASKI